jgi:hypothetical protein
MSVEKLNKNKFWKDGTAKSCQIRNVIKSRTPLDGENCKKMKDAYLEKLNDKEKKKVIIKKAPKKVENAE